MPRTTSIRETAFTARQREQAETINPRAVPFVPLDTNKPAYRHLRGTDREFITLGPTRNDEPTGAQE